MVIINPFAFVVPLLCRQDALYKQTHRPLGAAAAPVFLQTIYWLFRVLKRLCVIVHLGIPAYDGTSKKYPGHVAGLLFIL